MKIQRIKDRWKRRFKDLKKFWKVFSGNWMGVTGLVIIVILVLLAIFGSSLTPYGSHERTQNIFQPPSKEHWLGTNRFGQDVLTILFESLRISLLVGILAGSLTVIVGTIIGVSSAYIGGWFDAVVMRITDVFLVLPALPLMLLISSLPTFEQHWSLIAIIYVAVFWPVSTRLIRGQALSLKKRTFITSTKAIGANDFYVIFKHMLPNVFPLMLTMIITSMRQAILYESFLAFLGLGDPLNWSLGLMLRIAQNQASLATGAWWMIFPPGIAIGLTTLSFAFIGRAFDEIVDPRLQER